jgi:hypothetical protein
MPVRLKKANLVRARVAKSRIFVFFALPVAWSRKKLQIAGLLKSI